MRQSHRTLVLLFLSTLNLKRFDCFVQKHRVELERAVSLVEYINSNSEYEMPGTSKLNIMYPKVKHQIIKLDGLQNLLHSALVTGGDDVPEGHYEQDNMKETVVPNRNKIFASLIQAAALSVATKGDKQEVAIAKLTQKDVFDARNTYKNEKVTYKQLAVKYGVCKDTMQKAIRGINWSHNGL
jgi:7-cyano-7-deazaguanine synthase in queuosine biosynthesis